MMSGGTEEMREHNDDLAPHEISPSDVVKKVRSKEDVVLLDVRTLEEYEEVHLEDALLLPVQELSQESLTNIGLGEDAKDKEIILYCRSGARSQTAYNIMKSLGYTNIKSVAGGMIHWQEDQYPLTESGAYTGQMMMSENEDMTAAAVDGPRMVIDRIRHDFGAIPQYSGTVETTFAITNDGTETLEIGALSTSCACTKADISKKNIPVGDSAVLTVVFDPDLHAEPEGVFERTVFVPTNDPAVPEAEVIIAVDIIEGE
jgi:rhodanese-related sulfurtransferase